MRGAVLLSLTVALAGSSTACGGAQQGQDPQSVLHGYARALEEGRAEDAYRMLSDEARRGISLEAFRRMVHDDPEGVKDIGRALERPTAPPVVTATVTSPSGQELHLVLEGGGWHVDASSIDLYAQDSPRHAIQGFVRAVERKRYDIVMRFVPDTHREGLDAPKLQSAWEGHEKDEIRAGGRGPQAGPARRDHRGDGGARGHALRGRDHPARARARGVEDRELRLTAGACGAKEGICRAKTGVFAEKVGAHGRKMLVVARRNPACRGPESRDDRKTGRREAKKGVGPLPVFPSSCDLPLLRSRTSPRPARGRSCPRRTALRTRWA